MISSSDTTIDCRVKVDFVWFLLFWVFFLLQTFSSKTTSLRYVFDEVPSAKWPHKPCENFKGLSKSAIYIVFYNQNLDFQAPTTFCIFSVQLIHFTGGMFPIIQYISNICNISCTIDPIYPIDPLNSKNYVTLNDVNRYGKLRKQVVRKRQNSRRGFL